MDDAFKAALLDHLTTDLVGRGWHDVPFPTSVESAYALGAAMRNRWPAQHSLGIGFNDETGCVALKVTDPDDIERIRIALATTQRIPTLRFDLTVLGLADDFVARLPLDAPAGLAVGDLVWIVHDGSEKRLFEVIELLPGENARFVSREEVPW